MATALAVGIAQEPRRACRQIETEAAPIRNMAELFGTDATASGQSGG